MFDVHPQRIRFIVLNTERVHPLLKKTSVVCPRFESEARKYYTKCERCNSRNVIMKEHHDSDLVCCCGQPLIGKCGVCFERICAGYDEVRKIHKSNVLVFGKYFKMYGPGGGCVAAQGHVDEEIVNSILLKKRVYETFAPLPKNGRHMKKNNLGAYLAGVLKTVDYLQLISNLDLLPEITKLIKLRVVELSSF